MIRSISLLIIFCLLGSACSPKAVEQPIITVVESTPTLITSTPADRLYTIPIVPSETLKPTYTASPTVSPSNTLTPTPTPPGKAILAVASSITSSPDGNWLWGVVEEYNVEEGTQLQYYKTVIVSKDGKLVWTVWPKTKDIGNVVASRATYIPIFWLPSEPYVYLVGTSCCFDGPFGFTGMNLARLDLRTGAFNIQIPGWSPQSFVFSQRGKYLMQPHYGRLRFIRLFDWQPIDVPIDRKFLDNSLAVFSPDQDNVIVQSCVMEIDSPGCDKYSLLFVDIKSRNYRILLSDLYTDLASSIGFTPEDFFNSGYTFAYTWEDSNKIRITAQASENETKQFIIDLDTNTLREAR